MLVIGRLVRGRVRSEAQKGTEAALKLTQANLEGRWAHRRADGHVGVEHGIVHEHPG
jgi:hypothetical protein